MLGILPYCLNYSSLSYRRTLLGFIFLSIMFLQVSTFRSIVHLRNAHRPMSLLRAIDHLNPETSTNNITPKSGSNAFSLSTTIRKPKVIFVLGGPGAGKGTQCTKLANEYGMIHLSAGELLRQEMTTPDSEHGVLIDSYLKEGKIVPVKITLDLLKREILSSSIHNNRYLIDGFPRNWDNVVGWEEYMPEVCELEQVLVIDCQEEELERRLLSRGKTSGRSDDNIESARKRFQTFRQATLPVIQYFDTAKKVSYINGNHCMDHVYDDIKHAVNPLIEAEILQYTYALIDAISSRDIPAYSRLVDASVTTIEPDEHNHLMKGIDFHHQQLHQSPQHISIASIIRHHQVRVLGKVAIISYIRDIHDGNDSITTTYEETRVWHHINGNWINVHYHCSKAMQPL